MKIEFFTCWNTLFLSQKFFQVLPSIMIDYQDTGYCITGGDNRFCKQLNLEFAFLIITFQIRFSWSFYDIDKEL